MNVDQLINFKGGYFGCVKGVQLAYCCYSNSTTWVKCYTSDSVEVLYDIYISCENKEDGECTPIG